MRALRNAAKTVFIILIVVGLHTFSYVCAVGSSQENDTEFSSELAYAQTAGPTEETRSDEERGNFDIAALLSLLGVGLLKFVDDKLRIKLRDKFKTYRRCLIIFAIVFCVLEVSIICCCVFKIGPASYGNLKNVFLGLTPVVFCILTIITLNNDSNPIILSQRELEVRINEFTSSGMSPLGMIVGDMDFFGRVYNNKEGRRKGDNIKNNRQIKALVDNKIDSIEIVCKIPCTKEAKRRIGYLIEEFENRFKIRFFDEELFPIPKMRGRIMYKQNEQVVVITKKIRKPSQYEYSEYAVSSLPGGLFADLWSTVWSCSAQRSDILEECKKEYITYIN